MNTPFRSTLLVLATLAAIFATSSALAQWGWTDKEGRRIFSDQAPASEVPDKSIFKRPTGAQAKAKAAEVADAASAAASAPAGTASAPKAVASAAKPSGKDTELEKKKKEKETAEADKKKAEADKFAAAQAENCTRAKRSKASYDSGVRISTVNAKGEREYLDDAARAVETKRIEGIIAADCK
jgi:type IV secretory pathway VirB10-like protein